MSSPSTPNENDVLAGRGCGSQLYPGNVKFSNIVKRKKEQYALLKGNRQKNELAWQIYQEITSLDPPGRFLSKSSDGGWILQDERAVMIKVKQALRERSGPRPISPIHNANSISTVVNPQNTRLGSFTVTKHYSDFRAYLISDSFYLMNFASDDDERNYIRRFLTGVYGSLTWEELAQMCNYRYEESEVKNFLSSIWKLYPFLGKAYCIDSRIDGPIKNIRLVRKMDINGLDGNDQ